MRGPSPAFMVILSHVPRASERNRTPLQRTTHDSQVRHLHARHHCIDHRRGGRAGRAVPNRKNHVTTRSASCRALESDRDRGSGARRRHQSHEVHPAQPRRGDGLAGFGALLEAAAQGIGEGQHRARVPGRRLRLRPHRVQLLRPEDRLRHLPLRGRQDRRALGQPAGDRRPEPERPHDDRRPDRRDRSRQDGGQQGARARVRRRHPGQRPHGQARRLLRRRQLHPAQPADRATTCQGWAAALAGDGQARASR